MSLKIVATSIWSNPGNRGQRIRRTVSAVAWQAWKRIVRRPRRLTLFNGRRFIAHPDCVISSSLIYAQFPEYYELHFARRWLRADDCVIDVGANVGHIGLLLSDIVLPENILAFEPTPVTYQRLCENWRENDFSTEKTYQIAIGGEEATVWFRDVTHPDTMNAQVKSDAISTRPLREVSLRALDSFRDQWTGKSIGLLKIDVEGHEVAVFRGAQATLRDDRPRLIMFESLGGTIDSEIEATLHEAGYRVFQLDEGGEILLNVSNAQNVFAAPEELLAGVIAL